MARHPDRTVPTRRARAVAGAVLALGLFDPHGLRAQQTQPTTTAPTTSVAPVVSGAALERRIAENLRLLTGNNEPYAREIGARELLRMPAPAAWDRLAAVLRNSTDLPAQLAVCQAIADSPLRRSVLIEPLFDLIGAEPPALRQVVAAALGRYKNPAVIERLAAMARRVESSLPVRLGAIAALGAMGDDKQAIAALVGLLDDPNAELVDLVLDKIGDSSDSDLGDVEMARRWWDENKDMDTTAWLTRRNEQLRTRIARIDANSKMLTARLLAALRTNYYAASELDKPKLLIDLLADPLPEARGLGIELVDAMISDRRTVPQEIAARIEALVHDSSTAVRRSAATVLGDLRDKSRAPALLAGLAKETDSTVRAAQVAALGRIGGAAATQAVTNALDDPAPAVAGEAALALGALAEQGGLSPEVRGTLIESLLSRYERIGSGADNIREAFMTAMTRIGDPRFAPLFRKILSTRESAGARRAAIRGLAVTDPDHAADHLRPMLEDPDASIRSAAAEGLGRCARSDADLNALLGRLEPTREPDESARQKAWESVQRVLSTRSPEEHLAAAERFNRPGQNGSLERYVELLSQLDRRLAAQTAAAAIRLDVLERLATAQVTLGRIAAAAASLEQAAALAVPSDLQRARADLSRALDILMEAGRQESIPSLIERAHTLGGAANLLDLEAVGKTLQGALVQRAALPDSGPATELAAAVRKLLETGVGFPPPIREMLVTECRRVAQIAAQGRISDLISKLETNDDAARQARDALVAAGPSALPVVLNRLDQCASDNAPPAALELKLVDVARRLEPRWAGYGGDADAAIRAERLSELRAMTGGRTTASAPSG